MRSQAGLQRIRDHIDNFPGVYAGRMPSAIAILMKRRVSREPQEYNTVTPDFLEIIRERANAAQKLQIRNWMVSQGLLTAEDVADYQVEILDRVCDRISLGTITQGDVEGALALP